MKPQSIKDEIHGQLAAYIMATDEYIKIAYGARQTAVDQVAARAHMAARDAYNYGPWVSASEKVDLAFEVANTYLTREMSRYPVGVHPVQTADSKLWHEEMSYRVARLQELGMR